MAVIEIARFELEAGVDPHRFAEANRRVSSEYIVNQPGYLGSRETATDENGVWVVIVRWESLDAAEASMAGFMDDPVNAEFIAAMDADSLSMERFVLR